VRRSGRAFNAVLIAGVFWIGLVPIVNAQPPLRIGASVSQTGAYAATGQNQLRAYQLCIKQTNERGGILGRRLQLVVEDDHSEPARPPASTRSSSAPAPSTGRRSGTRS